MHVAASNTSGRNCGVLTSVLYSGHFARARISAKVAAWFKQPTLDVPSGGFAKVLSHHWGQHVYYLQGTERLEQRSGEVSELADEHDLGSCAERRRSSSLLFPTAR